MSRGGERAALEELGALEGGPLAGEGRAAVERALAGGSSVVAGRAAHLAAAADARELAPALERAFARFLRDPVKRDPGCVAKVALVKALIALEADAVDTLRRASHHVQMEPVWGGQADAAGELRGLAVQGLIVAGDRQALLDVARLVSDDRVEARRLAARAAGAVAHDAAEVLLRAKVHAGDAEPEVLGECFASLLQVAPERSHRFVATYLDHDDTAIAAAAALALGETRTPEAADRLIEAWRATVHRELREELALPIALTRSERAIDFLLERLGDDDRRVAIAAARALRLYRGDGTAAARIRAAFAEEGDPELEREFEQGG